MSKPLKQRNAYRANVTKEVQNFESLCNEGAAVDKFKVLLSKMLGYKEKIESLNDLILNDLTDDDAIDKEIADTVKYEGSILGFVSTVSMEIEKLCAVKAVEAKVLASPSDLSSASAKVKLPKLEISKFSGDPMKWREFWDSFTNTIDKNKELAAIDKFKYLKGYLEGDAWRLCEGYSLSSDNYEAVKAVLEERFGNPQLAIFSHLTALIEQPSATHSVKDLQKIFDESEKHIRSLVGLGLNEDQYGLVFCPILLSKLPLHVKMELHRKNGSRPWDLARLRDLLKQEIHARDMSERQFVHGPPGKAADQRAPNEKFPKSRNNNGRPFTGSQLGFAGKKGSFQPRPCAFCSGVGHKPDQCSAFPDHQSRRQKLGSGCVRCLSSNHNAQACQSRSSCTHCKKPNHHSSLCFSLSPSSGSRQGGQGRKSGSGLNPNASGFVPATNNTVHGTGSTGITNMQTAVAFCVGSDTDSSASLRLLFDTAGFRSYITSAAAKLLRAKIVGQETMSLGVFEEKRRRTRTYDVVEFFVHVQDGDPILIKANVTDFITCPVYCPPLNSSAHPILAQIDLAEPAADKPRNLPIDILIGGDQYYDFITSDQVRLSDGLILLSSRLGYVTAGTSEFSQLSIPGQTLLSTSFPSATDKDLNLERFWRLEDIGIKDECPSPADEIALQQVNSSRKRVEGRYFVKFPRRDNAAELPDNRELALGRLRSLWRKLSSNSSMLGKYNDILLEQVKRGIIEEVPDTPTGQVHYLPHHCVLKPESLTTPVRVVHDASSKTKKSVPSLNDTLYCGPLFLADLVGLLIRFRLNEVAIISDIEKAFLHIGLQDSERDLVRFFWVKDPSRPPRGDNITIYRFCRVPFGLVCSSFLLAACVLHHLSLYSQPAAKLMADNLYVDNIVVSVPNASLAKEYYATAKAILADASLNLRQWYTNSVELRSTLAKADVGKGGNVTKVLGIVWDTDTDNLRCPSISLDPSVVSTKRQLLQFVAKIFDPCGFFSPVAVAGKLLVQRAWEQKLEWDEPLPADFLKEWVQVGESIRAIPEHNIPRKAGVSNAQGFSLHCFCDASKKCYAAATFLKCGSGSDPHLLFSKTKLAPLTASKSAPRGGLTIPQLELMAVVVGCRMLRFVATELQLPDCQNFVWSDSQCVLHWVSQRGIATAFVKGRVKEIRDIAKEYNFSFRYVKSEDNPADCASRGSLLPPLIANKMWWHGPVWLKKDIKSWPASPVEVQIGTDADADDNSTIIGVLPSDHTSTVAGVLPGDQTVSVVGVLPGDRDSSLADVRRGKLVSSVAGVLPSDQPGKESALPACQSNATGQPLQSEFPESVLDVVNYAKFSSLHKLTRTIAMVQRFVANCRKPREHRLQGPCSVPETSTATNLLLRAIQQKHFKSVFSAGRDSKTQHMIRQLGIWKDDTEVLRCQTRLTFSEVEGETTFPILLPAKDHYTDLLIHDTHCRLFHAGTAHCLAELRQQYWIPKARPRIKVVLRNCKLCQRLKALRFRYPEPPPLPDFRVSRQEVFETTGLDYLGPLIIRSPEGDKKVWIVLFTCAAVRAIHLEVVEDMTTQQFLLAFRRFSALYGCPARLVSDNAKQFKTANLTFKKACDDGSLAQATGSQVEWKFIPERSPWFGGFYERLVALVKRCLRSALYFAKTSLLELQTLSYEISACLNTRPLTYIESELDSVPLSPANFLLKGSPNRFLTPAEGDSWRPDPGGKEADLILSWRRNKALLNKFWEMWQRAYLTGLKENERYLKQRNVLHREPEIGMTVLISDRMPKGQWKLARIVALNKSADGVVRSADVQLANGTRLRRALKLLCPLEASMAVSQNLTGKPAQPDPSRPRPTRLAAIQARSKIQNILNDDADDSDGEASQLSNQSVLLCAAADCHMLFADQRLFSGMAEKTRRLCFGTTDPLSRSYVHRPGYFVGGVKLFTSLIMGQWYIYCIQDGQTELGEAMHLNPHLRKNPTEIPRWLHEKGYTPSATVIFESPDILESLLIGDFDTEGPLFHAIAGFYDKTGFTEEDKVVACGKNHAYECGLRPAAAEKWASDDFPGANSYGEVVANVLRQYHRRESDPTYHSDLIANVPGFLQRTEYQKTVLILSDSICLSVKEVEGGTINARSGATFERLLEYIKAENIRFGDYSYVILHAGIDDIQRGRFPAQVMFMQLLDHILTVEVAEREYPPSRILISLPLLHPSVPEAFEYSVLVRSYCEPRGLRVVDWTLVIPNPFSDGVVWNPEISADDNFHVNHGGLTELWKAWVRVFPLLSRVSYTLKEDPVRRPRLAKRQQPAQPPRPGQRPRSRA